MSDLKKRLLHRRPPNINVPKPYMPKALDQAWKKNKQSGSFYRELLRAALGWHAARLWQRVSPSRGYDLS